jgi:hypothetical protein
MQQVFVAGTGRSGTTWIADVLASCRRCFVIYEPLRASLVPGVPKCAGGGDHPAVYLRPEDESAEWEQFFHSLFGGQVSCCWTRQEWRSAKSSLLHMLPARAHAALAAYQYHRQQRKAEHCIIKDIRGNMMIGWLSRRFPVRVVYLTRHPCAVVGSRLKLNWEDSLWRVIVQPALEADYLQPHRELIEKAATPLRRMAVHWCIENLVPLSQLAANPDWIALSYEACAVDPGGTFADLFAKLRLSPTPATASAMKALASSPTTDVGKPHRWHDPLSEAEGAEVLDICRQFGVGLYGRQPMPLCEHRAAIGAAVQLRS